MDAIRRSDSDSSMIGKSIILPFLHTGGPRYRAQNYQDAMAICRWAGYPDLFLTFTCNPKWPEINEMLHLIGQHDDDNRVDIICSLPDKIISTDARSEKTTAFWKNNRLFRFRGNRLINEELDYDKENLQKAHDKSFTLLNDCQKSVYGAIMASISNEEGRLFFIMGHGGTGKTFLWNAIISKLRSQSKIVLPIATSGIAALLLPNGRTAHSRFHIPLDISAESTCEIKQGSQLAELLLKTSLIIWDEAPMTNKFCFEAVDRTLRDILRVKYENNSDKPFGGLTVVFGEDFRQILPVISKGTRADIIDASLNSSYLWPFLNVYELKQNMQLCSGKVTDHEAAEITTFDKWLLQIGDGSFYDDVNNELIKLPPDICITPSNDPIDSIVEEVYPSLLQNYDDPSYLKERAILTPKNEMVQELNDTIMKMIPGEGRTYFISDNVCKASMNTNDEDLLYPPEFLNSLRFSGIPNHDIHLKAACGLTKKANEQIVDIDAADVNNEMSVLEYVEDSYRFYKLAEVNDFVCISGKTYRHEQVLTMQKQILGQQEWYLLMTSEFAAAAPPPSIEHISKRGNHKFLQLVAAELLRYAHGNTVTYKDYLWMFIVFIDVNFTMTKPILHAHGKTAQVPYYPIYQAASIDEWFTKDKPTQTKPQSSSTFGVTSSVRSAAARLLGGNGRKKLSFVGENGGIYSVSLRQQLQHIGKKLIRAQHYNKDSVEYNEEGQRYESSYTEACTFLLEFGNRSSNQVIVHYYCCCFLVLIMMTLNYH
ncbi:hypothetical protein FXO38_24089 [Capsicum annuum]|nr:hypothetical protein FXO38_24089 [Capsicum annuum]